MEEEIIKYLGIDWGSSKIGLALADGETKIALSYRKLENNKKTILDEIKDIIIKDEIDIVVVGVPMYLNQEKAVSMGERMGQEIKNTTSVKVVYQNEMFSTKIAEQNLKEKGMKRIKRFDDAEAARVILQSYLDGIMI
ncbi:MAG: Holliday junction resolvase RuvX [Parcubacteria group bacterium]|jgi:putative Holliday junction resolvase